MDDTKRSVVENGEKTRGIKPWLEDPYGLGEVLVGKRKGRGWTEEKEREFGELVAGGDGGTNGSLREFLGWKGGEVGNQIFPGMLPW